MHGRIGTLTVLAAVLGACEGGGVRRALVDDGGAAIDATGGASDGATPDAEPRTDAGAPDASVPDASAPDASAPDPSAPDPSAPDAGCAGGASGSGFRPVVCGAMAQPRWRHEAALLPDGRVLVVGGWHAGAEPWTYVHVAAVEVFDPATETFAVVGQLAYPRVGHRVTALADGRVLVTGGERDDAPHTLAAVSEIFDPATDTIVPGPTMVLARKLHTATLLADGRVLIAGGEVRDDPDPDSEGVAVAEVFDPQTNTFVAVGPMTDERHEHEAVRLHDGRVLLTGGADAPSCCDDGIDDAELFDPVTDTFTATGPLVTARPAHRTTRLADGRVLVTGGSVAHGGADGPTLVHAAELFDPAGGGFAATDPMTGTPGSTFTATRLVDGRVLVAGGSLGFDAELYQPGTGTFSTVGDPMVEARGMHTATLMQSGEVLLVGGHSLATAELFTP